MVPLSRERSLYANTAMSLADELLADLDDPADELGDEVNDQVFVSHACGHSSYRS